MSKENLFKFEEQVMKDEELQKKLEEAAKAYGGDKTDDKAVFEEVICPVAKEAGFEFTFEEAVEVRKEGQDEEIAIQDMKAVAGGGTSFHFDSYYPGSDWDFLREVNRLMKEKGLKL